MLLIRPATVTDAPLLLKFIRELAEYERQPNAVVIKEDTLIKDGFESQPKFRALIADWGGQAIGYALFFGFYSSWKGPGIFLEDRFCLRLLALPGRKAPLEFAGKSWTGMSRQLNSTSRWVPSFSMIGDKFS